VIFSKKLTHWHILFGTTMLLVIVLLSSCGAGNTTGTTAPPTPKPPTPTPTPNVLTQTFTGKDFTIKYPTNWKNSSADPLTTFTDPSGPYIMTIGTGPNPNDAMPLDKMANDSLSNVKASMKDAEVVNMPATITIDGQTWSQFAISDKGSDTGMEVVALATNRPDNSPNTKGYVIIYTAQKASFDQIATTYFMPMLQSFKFNS